MAIRRLVREAGFDPESATFLIAAYNECVKRLQLVDREDLITETLAKKIIEAAQAGERDPARLCQRAIDSLAA